MKISTEIDSIARILSEEEAVELVAKAGFDAWDFTMGYTMCDVNWRTKEATVSEHPLMQKDYLAYARKLRRIGLDNGIICNQSHAPFPSSIGLVRSLVPRAIECTAEAGGEICVVHPDEEKNMDENVEMFLEFLPFARQCGVKIAVENIFVWNNEKRVAEECTGSLPGHLMELIRAVNDDHFVACMDVGHAEMESLGTSAVDMIKKLGKELCALHVHDTDKRNDSHQIPFSMDIDFEGIVKALKETDYKGFLTLEAPYYILEFTKDNVFEGVKTLAEAAKKLSDMFENQKTN